MGNRSVAQRRDLIDPSDPELSIKRQCALLGISRSSYYYEPRKERPENLHYMRLMDEQYLKTPFYGVGQMTFFLRSKGYRVGPKRVRRLLRLMGLRAVCPGPHTSKPGKGTDHEVFPYLLRDLKIHRPGQVVSTDITYIPLRGGFLYLVAFMDWYSRFVLSWELSNTLEVQFCLAALDKVWSWIRPEIINTDQGSQYTSRHFVQAVLSKEVKLSMDGKGRAIDNIFIERLWRSLKYEEVYLKNYPDGRSAWENIRDYFEFYNHERPNKNLGGVPPAEIFFGRRTAPVIDRTAKM